MKPLWFVWTFWGGFPLHKISIIEIFLGLWPFSKKWDWNYTPISSRAAKILENLYSEILKVGLRMKVEMLESLKSNQKNWFFRRSFLNFTNIFSEIEILTAFWRKMSVEKIDLFNNWNFIGVSDYVGISRLKPCRF